MEPLRIEFALGQERVLVQKVSHDERQNFSCLACKSYNFMKGYDWRKGVI